MQPRHRLRKAWYELTSSLPRRFREPLRKAAATSTEYLGSISIRRNSMVPPLKTRVRGGLGNWTKIGNEFLEIFVEFGGLKPTDSVLEVGCGFGRIAIPVARYLDGRGHYEGFDIAPEAIAWCQTRVAPRYPNLRFRLVDIRNDVYNPKGSIDAVDFVFPYPPSSFTFVYLTSIFTHLLPTAVGHYVREISRVLLPGGRCVVTCFLLDDQSIPLMEAGKSEVEFLTGVRSHRFHDPAHPERAVAYDTELLRELFGEAGLKIVEPILWGSWSGRERFLSVQDIVIAQKE